MSVCILTFLAFCHNWPLFGGLAPRRDWMVINGELSVHRRSIDPAFIHAGLRFEALLFVLGQQLYLSADLVNMAATAQTMVVVALLLR